MQYKYTFVGIYLEEKNTKEIIDEKIKMKAKLTENVLSVVVYLQHY